jgi:hypothetical protein
VWVQVFRRWVRWVISTTQQLGFQGVVTSNGDK